MTEHAAVVFVFFFLAEYGSIVLMCILTSLLFLGGYLILDIIYLLSYLDFIIWELFIIDWILVLDYLVEDIMNTPALEGLIYGFSLGLKSSLMIFTFIWARASFPRIRFDQLMSFCWTVLLPIVFAFIILVPCIIYSMDAFPVNASLLTVPLVLRVSKDSINLDTSLPIQEENGYVSIPVHKVYTSLEDESTLSDIKKYFKLISGVYAFVNNQTNKVYIGSSFNLARRLHGHLNNLESNLLLQRAIAKYGLKGFTLYIIEIVQPNESEDNYIEQVKVELLLLEQMYIDLFKDKYNLCPVAGNTKGFKHSEETKELWSKTRTGKPHKVNLSSDETLRRHLKFAGENNPMYGKPVTDVNKKLISELFRKSVYLYDANTLTLIQKFNRHADLSREFNISPKTIIKYKDSGEVFRDKYIISSMELNIKDNSDTPGPLNSSVLMFGARASFPRIRFDQLMSFCWTVLLPIVFAFIILVPCILYSFDIFPININLF